MPSNFAVSNESFDFLSSSSDFLNIVLNNITSCVLLLDRNMELQAYNDALKTIFSNRRDEHLQYVRCGEAIGCAYQIDEQTNCGKTTRCHDCELRIAALTSYLEGVVVYKEHIVKPFFDFRGIKHDKHLQFSTRLFHFNNDKYIIMIIEDISRIIERQSK